MVARAKHPSKSRLLVGGNSRRRLVVFFRESHTSETRGWVTSSRDRQFSCFAYSAIHESYITIRCLFQTRTHETSTSNHEMLFQISPPETNQFMMRLIVSATFFHYAFVWPFPWERERWIIIMIYVDYKHSYGLMLLVAPTQRLSPKQHKWPRLLL